MFIWIFGPRNVTPDQENKEALGCCLGCLVILVLLILVCCGVPFVAKTFPLM